MDTRSGGVLLQIKEVSKSYPSKRGETTVLEDVSLELRSGDFVAIRGPSGCGKTTLLLIAGGLLRPDAGEVVVDGRSLYELCPEDRARVRSRRFGFVYQQFHLMPYLDVLDNVLVPTLVTRRNERSRAAALIENLGLEHRIYHKPSELSIGERQRTALARALLCRPGILLADEPTGNLDEENTRIVLEHLRKFAEDGGAVLVATHDRIIAERTGCHLMLRDGRITKDTDITSNDPPAA